MKTTVLKPLILIAAVLAFWLGGTALAQPAPAAGSAAPAAAAPAPAAAPAGPLNQQSDDAAKADCLRKHTYPEWICNKNYEPWDTGGTFWMPTAAAKGADGSDFMFYAVLGLSLFFFIAITAAIVYFVIKYRHRPGHKAQPSPAHSDALEITWTIIPTIMCIFLFIGGWDNYIDMETRPADAYVIKVTAKKWNWDFEYPGGLHLANLVVPKDQAVELDMTSVDVIHSFYVPAFRFKQDVVPRRITFAYFTPTRPGVFRLYCAEYCGKDHSQMKVRAIVLEKADFDHYLSDYKAATQNMDPKDLGEQVYNTKGCKGCHSVDGTRVVGPTWKGSWGNPVPLEGGKSETMNEAYVKQSVTDPASEIHQGYPNAMPSYAGQLSEAEIHGVAAYIESLKQ